MSEHYDVIIIGTGAGGGTLAHRLAPSGKRILLLERGGYLPREPENWDCRRGLRQGALPVTARSGIDKDGERVPAPPAVLRRRQHEVLRRDPVPPARARLRRGPPLRRHLAGVADRLRGPRALLRRGRAALPRPRRRRGEDPTEPPRSGPFPYPAVSHEPRIQQLARRPRAHRPPPVPPAGRRRPRRVRPRGGPLRALRPLRRLPLPRPTARPTRTCCCVRPGARAPERHAAHARARSSGSRPTRRGRAVTEVVVDRRGARSATAPTSSSSPAARSTRAALLLRSATDAPSERAGQLAPTSVGPQLHGPHQLGRDRDLADAERRRSSRRRSASTTTTGAPTTPSYPLGHIQMLGKSRPQHPARRARRGSPRAWRSTTWPSTRSTSGSPPRTCPHPDNRVTVDRDGRIHLAKTVPQRRAAPAAAGASSRACSASSAATERLIPRCVGARPAHPARRHRPPVRHGALRRRPGDVGARRQLQGPRPRQPLRRRHELLPVVERGEPGADRDGQRAARRRPPARAARRRRAARQRQHDRSSRRSRHERASTRSPPRSARAWSPASPAPPR